MRDKALSVCWSVCLSVSLACPTLCIYTSFAFSFVLGKVNHAKGFIFQIADLGRNRHRFAYLDNKSVSKY